MTPPHNAGVAQFGAEIIILKVGVSVKLNDMQIRVLPQTALIAPSITRCSPPIRKGILPSSRISRLCSDIAKRRFPKEQSSGLRRQKCSFRLNLCPDKDCMSLIPELSCRMAAEPNLAPGRKLVVESKGAPNKTILASSYSPSQPIKVSTFFFNSQPLPTFFQDMPADKRSLYVNSACNISCSDADCATVLCQNH